jgi:hypothetical protein
MSNKRLVVALIAVLIGMAVIPIAAIIVLRTRGRTMQFFDSRHPNVAKTKAEAAKIIHALEQYVDEHGAAPATLDDLVPKYIPKIPQPHYGVPRWDYAGQTDSIHYSLAFGAEGGYPAIYYTSQSADWHVDE